MKKSAGVLIIFTIILSLFLSVLPPVMAEGNSVSVDVMFTSDVHSHLNSFTTNIENEQKNIGGSARINTLVKNQKKKNPDTLLVDAGDFSMGTLIQTLFATDAPELTMMGFMGYDFVTLGNHEFDYGSKALAQMFNQASTQEYDMPKLVVCNLDWTGDLSENQLLLKSALEEYGTAPYYMTQKNGVNIAVIGVFGKDSLACAPTCELKFSDPVTAVKDTIKEIKSKEKADMIVLLSHSGLDGKSGKSEDEQMAENNPEIDLIISGHSHTVLKEQIQLGETHIVATGEYGEWVGNLTLTKKDNGRWDLSYYELVQTDEEVSQDKDTLTLLDTYNNKIQSEYLDIFGYEKDEVIARNNIRFSTVPELYQQHTDQNLGNFLADAYAHAVEKDGTKVDVAVAPSGTIRGTIPVGDLTIEEIFNIFPLGVGQDGVIGFPLIKIYLYGSELRTLAEVDASISDLMTNARLFFYGMKFSYNPNRIILDRTTDCFLNVDGNRVPIEDDKLYCLVSDMYSGQMLGAVTKKSYGILSVIPKDENGNPINDFTDAIVYGPDGSEIKVWVAIAEYLGTFGKDEDSIPVITERYKQGYEERKIVNDDNSTVGVLGHPGASTKIVCFYIPAVILFIILLVVIFKKIKRRRQV